MKSSMIGLIIFLVLSYPAANAEPNVKRTNSSNYCEPLVAKRLAHVKKAYKSFYKRMLNVHTRGLSNIRKNSDLFIGDSIVHSLAVSAIGSNTVNLGIGTDDTIGVLTRIKFYEPALKEASRVILAVGVNDLPWRNNNDIEDTYRCILDRIPDGPEVIISSVLPISSAHHGRMTEAHTAQLKNLNRRLNIMAKDRRNTRFIDHSSAFIDETTGELRRHLHIGDGVHLSPAGYEVWIQSLRQALGSGPSPEEKCQCD